MKNKFGGIKTPRNRSEFEHNIHLVQEETRRKLNSGNQDLIDNVMWATIPHLKRLKQLPNKRLNLTSIDEMLRLQANMLDSDIFNDNEE
jgi:hypothetical protein